MPEAKAAPVVPAQKAAPVVPAAPAAKAATPAPAQPAAEPTYDDTGVTVIPEQPAESGTTAQNPSEQAPEAQAEGQTPTGEPPEQREKQGKNRYERRLDKAYRRAAEAEARAQALERQYEELKPKDAPLVGAPRLEDFTDIQEYAKAFAKFESAHAIKEYERKQKEESFRRETERLSKDWEDRVSKAESKYDDFDEVVGELQPNSPLAMAIMQAENGDDIAYYLGTHLQEAAKIAQLEPLAQAREIGRLETKLLAEPPKAKMPSKAPAPIVPLNGKSAGASDEPLDTDDIATWMKKANAKSRKSLGL